MAPFGCLPNLDASRSELKDLLKLSDRISNDAVFICLICKLAIFFMFLLLRFNLHFVYIAKPGGKAL
jgi:hypothetical protein